MTESGEHLFERFCASLGLQHERIAEATEQGEQRPDYRVVGSDGAQFVAEVKLVSPTAEEARDIARVYRGEIFATGGTPGDRMRRWIGKANQQLKALGDQAPGVLVVFNPEVLLRRHTDPYAILTAMRGFDTIDVHVPLSPTKKPVFGELRSGGGKKMTPFHNTSTSAVVCPEEIAGGVWRTGIYHNRFAARPLAVSTLQEASAIHFRITDDERDWTQLRAAV